VISAEGCAAVIGPGMVIMRFRWDMAAAMAIHLVKVEPEKEGWWIKLAYATRGCEGNRERRGDPAPGASCIRTMR
jgi:hypothetical protein